MRIAIMAVLCAAFAFAQGPEVTISQGPSPNEFQIVYGYTGANLVYVCYAKSRQPTSGTISISAASNANPVSLTSTGHGFNTNSRPRITISGATGNWTPINGAFTATITGANTFTIPVDSTTFGALAGTVVFTTVGPRTNQPQWAVKQFAYDASSNLVSSAWLGGSSALQAKCSDATSTTTNVQ